MTSTIPITARSRLRRHNLVNSAPSVVWCSLIASTKDGMTAGSRSEEERPGTQRGQRRVPCICEQSRPAAESTRGNGGGRMTARRIVLRVALMWHRTML